ncbi:MAG: 2'-5' RNA ligase family protein [Anaerolineaceae bacterium]|nr:2'-5' RNA ligase family protein [Anaerolineaceae bacterium]
MSELSTAVVTFAPPEVQAHAAPLMRRYAPDDFVRVPPHITILYPFVPVPDLDAACRKLTSLCANVAPFDITMQGYSHFTTITYMQPANPQPIQALCQRIFAVFPECPPYRGAHGNTPTPHMTVGIFDSAAERKVTLFPDYAPITFRVGRLHVIYGVDDEPLPWLTHAVIQLDGAG